MNVRHRTARALCVGALIGAAALTACGGSDTSGDATSSPSPSATANGVESLTADEILQEVSDALDMATSVHVVGEQDQDGKTNSIDMNVTSEDGGSATGTLTIDGETVTIIAVDDSIYFSAETTYWESLDIPQATIDQIDGKFVKAPAAESSFGQVTDFDTVVGQLTTAEGKVEKGSESTVDGIPVIELIDTKDDGVLSISLEGEPLPVQVTSTQTGEVRLTDWNAPVVAEAPPAEDVIDSSELSS